VIARRFRLCRNDLRFRFLSALLGLLLVGGFGTSAAEERAEALDRDGDGRPEVWIHRDESGKPIRSEVDRNGDGRPDLTRYLADGGLPQREEADLNFDGRLDAWSYYEVGSKRLMWLDKNGDGEPDARFYYGPDGIQLIGGEMDEDFDGVPDRSFGAVPPEESRRPDPAG